MTIQDGNTDNTNNLSALTNQTDLLDESTQSLEPLHNTSASTASRAARIARSTQSGFQQADAERFFFMAAGIKFSVVDFMAREMLSTPFQVDLTLALEESYPADEVLGSAGVLSVDVGEQERFFNGIVNRFVQTGVSGRFMLFQAQLVPQLWLLSLEQDCRIFQDMTVVDIFGEVLRGSGIPSNACSFSTGNN
jgi:type VI secretion system secreted protein VgrG